MRVAFPDAKRTWCCDAFPSIDKIHRIRSIVLIIHGTEDDVIDVSHGFALYNRVHTPHQIEPLWVDGAGHNDIEVSFWWIVFRIFDDASSGTWPVCRKIITANWRRHSTNIFEETTIRTTTAAATVVVISVKPTNIGIHTYHTSFDNYWTKLNKIRESYTCECLWVWSSLVYYNVQCDLYPFLFSLLDLYTNIYIFKDLFLTWMNLFFFLSLTLSIIVWSYVKESKYIYICLLDF